jgi:hypothetical protein
MHVLCPCHTRQQAGILLLLRACWDASACNNGCINQRGNLLQTRPWLLIPVAGVAACKLLLQSGYLEQRLLQPLLSLQCNTNE